MGGPQALEAEEQTGLTGRERIRLTFQHQEPDRVPFFEQGIASRVASDVLGRPALTGGGSFRFQAALAAYQGPDAWAEFQGRYLKDYADLVQALDLDMVSAPWVPGGDRAGGWTTAPFASKMNPQARGPYPDWMRPRTPSSR
jgi:hypothetical protein